MSIAVLVEGKAGFAMTAETEIPRSTILLSITPGEPVVSKISLSTVPGVCLEMNGMSERIHKCVNKPKKGIITRATELILYYKF